MFESQRLVARIGNIHQREAVPQQPTVIRIPGIIRVVFDANARFDTLMAGIDFRPRMA